MLKNDQAGLLGANTINIAADLAGMADAADMLSGVKAHWFGVVFAVLISWATVRLRYHQIANVLKWLVLVVFAYPTTAFVVGADWGGVIRNTLVPSMPHTRDEWSKLLCTLLSELCSVDQSYDSFPAYALSVGSIYRGIRTVAAKGVVRASWKETIMTHIINKPIPKLRRAPQPPLSHPGATPDSDRAKKPPLAEPPATDQELNPGDRVEGLGNFGKPTGEFGTVEQANEDDAVVKWDDDGRKTLHQPSLKKV